MILYRDAVYRATASHLARESMFVAIGVSCVHWVLAVVGVCYGIYCRILCGTAACLRSTRRLHTISLLTARATGESLCALLRANGRDDLLHDGVFGIVSAEGYGQVGRIVEAGPGYSVREYTPLTATISEPEPARLDIYAFPDNLTHRTE